MENRCGAHRNHVGRRGRYTPLCAHRRIVVHVGCTHITVNERVESAVSEWTVKANGDHRTTLSVTSTIETRFGLLGAAMEKLALKPRLTSTLRIAVGEFKSYMENLNLPRTLGVEALEPRVA